MALAHAPDPFTFFPFRKGAKDDPDWSTLTKFIKANYASNFNGNIQSAVDRLSEWKKVIAATCHNELKQPPNEAFIEMTLKPYVQLVATAQSHLPLHSGAVKGLSFEWKDSLDDSFKHSSTNCNVEVFSCIYNIAACYAYTASVDAESGNVDGVKNAFKTYQLAAGVYQTAEAFLKRLPAASVVRDATVESISALAKLCLCQAHHCSYLKAEFEMKGKHALLAKMAMEGGKQYDDQAKLMVSLGWPRTTFVKDLEVYAANMAQVFFARAHLHLATERMDAGEVGEAIGRFNSAIAHISRVTKFTNGNMNSWVKGINAAVTDQHAKAVSANETVYFLRIAKDLPPPEGLGKSLGKATAPLPLTRVTSNRDVDPFFGIVPAHIADVSSKHFAKMRELATSASHSVSSYRENIRRALNNLGVVAVISSLSHEVKDKGKVPEPLRSKIIAVKGGNVGTTTLIQALFHSVVQMGELRSAAFAKLTAINECLTQEREQDESLAREYGDKMWRSCRPQSVLTPTYQEIAKLQICHNEVIIKELDEPLNRLKNQMAADTDCLVRLDWCMDDIDALLPYMKTKAVKEQDRNILEKVEKLKSLMTRFDQIDEDNNVKQRELNAVLEKDDIIHSLSSVDSDQYEGILDAASNDVKDMIAGIKGNVTTGESLLSEVENIINVLALTKSEDPVAVEVQKICNILETMIDLYQKFQQELTDLQRYATQCIEAVDGTLSSAQSFALARSMEAEDIKSALEAQINAKMKERQEKELSDISIASSQERQNALRKEIEELERQQKEREQIRIQRMSETNATQQNLMQQIGDESRNERLQQLLNRQRDGASQPFANAQQQPVMPPSGPPPPSYYSAVAPQLAPNQQPYYAQPLPIQPPVAGYPHPQYQQPPQPGTYVQPQFQQPNYVQGLPHPSQYQYRPQ